MLNLINKIESTDYNQYYILSLTN